jgi:hypothetical protein
LESLTPEELRVVQLRLGLQDGKGRTLDEVASVLGVSADAIRDVAAGIWSRTGFSIRDKGPMFNVRCPERGCKWGIGSEYDDAITQEDCQSAAEDLLWHFKTAHLPPELQPKIDDNDFCLGD